MHFLHIFWAVTLANWRERSLEKCLVAPTNIKKISKYRNKHEIHVQTPALIFARGPLVPTAVYHHPLVRTRKRQMPRGRQRKCLARDILLTTIKGGNVAGDSQEPRLLPALIRTQTGFDQHYNVSRRMCHGQHPLKTTDNYWHSAVTSQCFDHQGCP